MGLEEDRAGLIAAVQALETAVAQMQNVESEVETATSLASNVIQSYENTALVEATGLIAEASMKVSEAKYAILGASERLNAYIQQMS